jgi:hypothetical protein
MDREKKENANAQMAHLQKSHFLPTLERNN